MKLLIDTSIIDDNKISQLKSTALNDLLKKRSLIIYGNPTLLQETFDLWLKGSKEKAKSYLEYIINISNGRWFRSLDEITKLELEGHNLGRQYYFMTEHETTVVKEKIYDQILKGNMSSKDEMGLKAENDKSIKRKEMLKASCVNMRDNMSKTLKDKGLKFPSPEAASSMFLSFCDSHIDSFAETEIMTKMETSQDRKIMFNKWKANKGAYPYFTFWIKAALFIAFNALIKPSDPIDPNASEDIIHLTQMKTLDIFISDDIKFQKNGFTQLYGDSKKYWSFDEFIKYIKAAK
ncbi:hypothetical protein HZC35_07185 [Candidatus Saganbacteria bacterium]|nr:hypothetical protein [Candidatus Saganbacteria bacterium]